VVREHVWQFVILKLDHGNVGVQLQLLVWNRVSCAAIIKHAIGQMSRHVSETAAKQSDSRLVFARCQRRVLHRAWHGTTILKDVLETLGCPDLVCSRLVFDPCDQAGTLLKLFVFVFKVALSLFSSSSPLDSLHECLY